MKHLRVGISPCPNDTFAFHALLERKIETPGMELTFEFGDIEELNRRFARGELDASKLSFAAALALDPSVRVLAAGAALGFGVGPVLLAAPGRRLVDGRVPHSARVLAPGAHTTATLLYRLFHAGEGRLEQALFSAIMPALERGQADFGVCIHEGRFTYREHGLELAEDLGRTWEARTHSPLPLGGIVARADLGDACSGALEDAIRRSIEYAQVHRAEALITMRAHAQETSDEVLWQHVELYVNEWTRDLGAVGRRAILELGREAARLHQSP